MPGAWAGVRATPTTDMSLLGRTASAYVLGVINEPAAISTAARCPTTVSREPADTGFKAGSELRRTRTRSSASMTAPRSMSARAESTSWVLLVVVQAQPPMSAPRQLALMAPALNAERCQDLRSEESRGGREWSGTG